MNLNNNTISSTYYVQQVDQKFLQGFFFSQYGYVVLLVYTTLLVRFALMNVQPGLIRLLLATPTIALTLISPLYLDFENEGFFHNLIYTFTTIWIMNSRLIQFCFNRGEILKWNKKQGSLVTLCLAISIPVVIDYQNGSTDQKEKQKKEQEASINIKYFIPFKLGMVVLLLTLLSKFPGLSPLLRSYSMGWGFYMVLSSTMDIFGVVASNFDIQLESHFNKPFLSASLQEFWAKRWNLTAAKNLRDMVYGPIMDGKLIGDGDDYIDTRINIKSNEKKKPTITQIMVAQFFVFLFSGLVHQIIYYYLSQGKQNWSWCLFFIAQWPILVVEHLVYKQLKGYKMMPPKVLRILLTQALLAIFAKRLFFDPFIEAGAIEKSLKSITAYSQSMQQVKEVIVHYYVTNFQK